MIPVPPALQGTGMTAHEAVGVYWLSQGDTARALEELAGFLGREGVQGLPALAERLQRRHDDHTEMEPQWAAEHGRPAPSPPLSLVRQGARYLQNLAEHGHGDEAGWMQANWGTRDGAYRGWTARTEAGELDFGFDTAWSSPAPVLQRLVQLFPDLSFTGGCIDEGWCFALRLTGAHGRLTPLPVRAEVENPVFRRLHLEVFGREAGEETEMQRPEVLN